MVTEKLNKRINRRQRVRAKIKGSAGCPRLSVFRSNKRLTLQLVDDEKGSTILFLNGGTSFGKKGTKTETAFKLGEKLAAEAKKKNIKKVVFDKGGYAYHGRVKAVAEGARKGGLLF